MVALKAADVQTFLARPNKNQPVVLIFGPDAGLVRERVLALLKASVADIGDPFSLVRLSGDELSADPARLLDEAATMPLLGGRRALWVKAGARNFAAALELLLTAPPPDCRVVIEAGDLKRNAPLRALCERARTAATIACYADSDRDLARLVDDELRDAKLRITPEARALLIPLLGGDRQVSRNEITKLVLYASGKTEIEADDVLAVVADAAALALDNVIDAAFAGWPADVATHFARSCDAGATPSALLSAALRHAAQLHLARLAIESGGAFDSAADRHFPGLFFRRKPAIEAALRAWTADRLSRVMAQLWEASRAPRAQKELGPMAEPIAERALLSIAQSARAREAAGSRHRQA